MSSGYERAGANANLQGERSFTISGKVLHPIAEAMRVMRAMWPNKTANEIAIRSQSDERTCKHWLAHAYEPSGRALVNLLRSDAGPLVLDALMCDPVPTWYARQKLVLDIYESERSANESKKKLTELRRDLTRR